MKQRTKNIFVYAGALLFAAVTVTVVLVLAGCRQQGNKNLGETYISPSAVALTPDGGIVVADAGKNRVCLLNQNGALVSTAQLDGAANGVCVKNDGVIYVTYGALSGKVAVFDGSLNKKADIDVGHTPVDPVLSPDQSKLYVANRFTGNISVIDTANNTVTDTVCEMREPVALAVTSDGTLYVGAYLPDQPMTDKNVACAVKAVAPDGTVTDIQMTNGTTAIRDLCVTPDGQYVVASHVIGRYGYPTTQLDRGWINTNALSLVSVKDKKLYRSVLLDAVDSGAANPYGVTAVKNGEADYIAVSLAGTNQLELIRYDYLLQKLAALNKNSVPPQDDLTFLDSIRYRLDMPGIGPRMMTAGGETLYVCQYFSGNIVKINSNGTGRQELSLGDQPENNVLRTGEIAWNDGRLCYQGWQTCESCHPSGRADALNWDNLNDGLGNSKQTKSLLYCYFTPPEMITGIRASAEIATRAGMKYIEFSTVDEEILCALDEYIKSMQPEQSPYLLRDGSLSDAAKRGKALFESEEVGCAVCHPAPYFTDLHMYDVGSVDTATDGESQVVSRLDTPSLIEIWRTAPYLYNGKAKTVYDVLTTFNKNDTHGHTGHLSESELRDLEQYVLSIGNEGEDFVVQNVKSVDGTGNELLSVLRPGTTVRTVEVRRLLPDAASASVTVELFDKNGNSLSKVSKNTPALSLNETATVDVNISVPEDLESGAYLKIFVYSGNNDKATDMTYKYIA